MQVARFQRLDRGLRADRHEDRGLDRAVRGPEPAETRAAVAVFVQDLERAGRRGV